jgi:hypothetical protein
MDPVEAGQLVLKICIVIYQQTELALLSYDI